MCSDPWDQVPRSAPERGRRELPLNPHAFSSDRGLRPTFSLTVTFYFSRSVIDCRAHDSRAKRSTRTGHCPLLDAPRAVADVVQRGRDEHGALLRHVLPPLRRRPRRRVRAARPEGDGPRSGGAVLGKAPFRWVGCVRVLSTTLRAARMRCQSRQCRSTPASGIRPVLGRTEHIQFRARKHSRQTQMGGGSTIHRMINKEWSCHRLSFV